MLNHSVTHRSQVANHLQMSGEDQNKNVLNGAGANSNAQPITSDGSMTLQASSNSKKIIH